MTPSDPKQIPPLLSAVAPRRKSRAPTLYAIIALKLIKGVLLLLFALVVFSLWDENVQEELSRTLRQVNPAGADPTLAAVEQTLRTMSFRTIQLFAAGSFLYGAFAIVEGAGLIFRAAWAGWMVIAESAVFVPLEIWEVLTHYSLAAVLILVLNIGIVWYLYANRIRLFSSQRAGGTIG